MHREIARLVDRQGSWAKPLGERVQGCLSEVFAERRPLKDALNGTWLGHPVHPVATDVAIGGATIAAVLDVAGHDRAADLAVATGLAGMVASAATGAADAVDAHGRPQVYATVHATLMVTSLAAYAGSMLLRVGPRAGRPIARMLGFAGLGAMTAGAYLGGDLTYRLGSQVDRHAFEGTGTRWRALDVRDVPSGALVRAKAGADPIVLYRADDDSPIVALHATCAHAGGPLDKGTVEDGCVTCPWHGSRFRLADGRVVRGPAVFDQPGFEVRETADGGLEACRR
jgi:nitrite reductase/ring-hydroxylating ferredoxin subunit/uncharacterized membrane protein